MKSCWKPTSEIFPGSSLMTSLIPLLAPRVPSFSSFSISTDSAITPSGAAATHSGLFKALVGDPNIMMSDYLENPAKYEEGVYDLLLDLTAGHRSLQELKPEEQEILDRAVIDFNSPNRRPVPPPPPPPKESPKEQEIEYHEPVSSPFRGEVPYWWT